MTNLPPHEYYASLPKQITGAAAIYHAPDGRILLVRPSYRDDTWELPGGGLEAGEDPLAAATRETKEELGIDLTPGRLLVIDWVPEQQDGRPPLVNVLFDAGEMTDAEAAARIRLDPDELTEYRLATGEEWGRLLAPHMARRLHACAKALATGSTVYLHHGYDPTIER